MLSYSFFNQGALMKKTKLNLLTQLLLTTVFSTTVAQQAFAVDFGSVTSGVPLGSVTSGSSADYASDPSSAPNQAPSQASLTTFEPQSVVSQKYINIIILLAPLHMAM